ncbi:glycosyltransferase family 4 protein [Candidatus Bathyarchaeota archaeon]|nr:glycosyltransferase family 4 protein [Candidatus Bathyarchaeota archaeon]
MKVTIVSPFYTPSIGGVETIARDTAEELVRRGHEVHVVTTTCDNTWEKIAEAGEVMSGGVVIHRLNPSSLKIGYSTLMEGLKGTVEEIRPDIVHSHNLHPHLFQLINWKQEIGYGLVAQLHYPTVTGIDSVVARGLYRPTMWNLARNQGKVDGVVAHGVKERDWLVGEKIDEERIRKIRYPAVPARLLEYEGNPVPELEGVDGPVVLYIGRITWRKGVHVLVDAVKSLVEEAPNLRVVIAGPPEKDYLEKIRSAVEQKGLQDNVVLEGALSEKKKYDYMCASTVFVSPSIKDIHPITLLEAQALGTPVVSTNIAAIPDIVRDGETGILVESEDPEALKEAIGKITRDAALRRRLSQGAREWASSLSLESSVDSLEDLYSDILENRR